VLLSAVVVPRYVEDVPTLADVLRSSAAVLPVVGALFGVP
jgi:hypothetical protein